MANIKNAIYQVLGTGEETDTSYHYETNVGMTKVLDSSKNEVGNVEEALFTGKVVNNVDWKTLKVKGAYSITNIRNVTGVTISADKRHILLVDPVGPIGAPTFTIYKLYAPTGEIYENVIVNGTEIGWTSGGKAIKDSQVQVAGQIATLQTAMTTANTNNTNTNTKVNSLRTDFTNYQSHNHDGRYMRTSGGDISGNINIKNDSGLNIKSANNTNRSVAHVSTTDLLTLGNVNYGLNLVGKGEFKYNNTKIWTESNDGAGSGLDADKLGGKESSKYATLDTHNIFSGNVTSTGTVKGNVFQIHDTATIRAQANGRITFKMGGSNDIFFETSGRISAGNHIVFNAKNNESGFKIALSDSEASNGGMGMYRNTGSRYLGFYNWTKSERMAYFDADTSMFYLDKAPSITGRRLYLQSGTPAGNHKAGDIWIK